MISWLLAARSKTLVAGLVPVMVGSAAAYSVGSASFAVFFSALFGAVFIQIGTNYINDGADFLRGADNQERVGPKRMAQLGKITPRQLFLGAGVCFFLAASFGAYLVSVGGWPIVAIGVVSILAAIAYTAGPFPLAYLGLGDLFVLIFFGLVAVCGTYFANGNEVGLTAVVLGLAVGFHAVALIAVNNIRDIATDTIAGKKTLAVRFGERRSKFYIFAMLLLPYILISWLAVNVGATLLLVYASFPLAVLAGMKVIKAERPEKYMNVLPLIALVQFLFGVFLSGALYLLAVRS